MVIGSVVIKLLGRITFNSDLKGTVIYIGGAIITIAVCVVLHWISSFFLPKTTAIICGGRI